MSICYARAGLWGAVIALIPFSGSSAHEIVGNRFFPATLGIDDPGVNDEMSLPTVDSFKTGDIPPVRPRDISAEFSKRITEDLQYRLARPTPSSAQSIRQRPVASRTWRPCSNIGCSKAPSMSS
ncbi:hypothetical protein QA641_13690 [Bradyrhizobium sp. CB1650]|uniref:hypothetical protein n=1 Tax=Bradyrhizobium sp. CB1650 TaxID=3039153 RepID=UPI002434D12C|nr:hypothetical protein [Bradyrhizobium sp. CB1650]WGD54872.1 hypothetical protein QA641_13690 [Bradyrhizobium sp. CB1650]